jgi:hypothetical protein
MQRLRECGRLTIVSVMYGIGVQAFESALGGREEKHLNPVRMVCRAGARSILVVNISNQSQSNLVLLEKPSRLITNSGETRLKNQARLASILPIIIFCDLKQRTSRSNNSNERSAACGMIRCTVIRGSTTARWLRATRSYSTKPGDSEDPKPTPEKKDLDTKNILGLLLRWERKHKATKATTAQSSGTFQWSSLYEAVNLVPRKPRNEWRPYADPAQREPEGESDKKNEVSNTGGGTTIDPFPLADSNKDEDSDPEDGKTFQWTSLEDASKDGGTKAQDVETLPWSPLDPVRDTEDGVLTEWWSSSSPAADPTNSNESKTIAHARPTPSKRPSLPLSPLMDPSVISAKTKYNAPKPLPNKETQTDFQQALAKNPYALALATPVRKCRVFEAHLPSFFLQPFTLMEHPKTREPWFVPADLSDKYSPSRTVEEGVESEGQDVKTDREGKRVGDTPYILCRTFAIRALSDYKMRFVSKSNPVGLKLSVERVKHMRAAFEIRKGAGWREDMDAFVVELMRRRLVSLLVHINSKKRGYLLGCTGWEDAEQKTQVGAYLWTGGNMDKEGDQPPEFATLWTGVAKSKKTPVHNLRFLLGREKLQELREKCKNGIWDREVIVLKHKQMTVDLQMRLWKLRGLLAEFRPVEDAAEDASEEDEMDEDDEDESPDDAGEDDPLEDVMVERA